MRETNDIRFYKKLQKNGVLFYNPIRTYRKVLGLLFIGVGVVTLPLPTGSIFLILLGCLVMGVDIERVKNLIMRYKYKMRLLKWIK